MVKGKTVGLILGAFGGIGLALYLLKDTIADAISPKPMGFYVTPTTWSTPGKLIFRFYLDREPLRNVAIFAHSSGSAFRNLMVRTDSQGRGVVETIVLAPPLKSTGDIKFELDPVVSDLPTSLFFTIKFVGM